MDQSEVRKAFGEHISPNLKCPVFTSSPATHGMPRRASAQTFVYLPFTFILGLGRHMRTGQGTTCESRFSPYIPTVWVLSLKLRASALALAPFPTELSLLLEFPAFVAGHLSLLSVRCLLHKPTPLR